MQFNLFTQNLFHNELIFRLLLKITVDQVYQCEFNNFSRFGSPRLFKLNKRNFKCIYILYFMFIIYLLHISINLLIIYNKNISLSVSIKTLRQMTSLLQQLNQVLNTKQKVKIDSEKVILLQNQVISVLKKQIAILRNVITRHAKKQDINKNNHPTENIYSQMGSQAVQLSQLPVLKVQNQRLSTEISSKKKKIQQILNIADCSWDQIEQYTQKLKNTERKPIFIEKIKQKQVPIIVQKIKQVQIIVPIEIKKQIITPIMIQLWNEVKGEQRIIEVIKYIEKEVPIFKEKIVHKYLPPPGSSRRPLICVQTQTQ